MKLRLIALALAITPIDDASTIAQPRAVPAAISIRPLFLLLYRPGPAWRAGRPMHEQDLRAHAIYHRNLVRDGRSFAAGGYSGMDGGMSMIRAANLNEARAILAADPAIVNRVFVGELRLWTPRYYGSGPLVESQP